MMHINVNSKTITPANAGYMYTVNQKKGGSTFVIVTLENLDRFL